MTYLPTDDTRLLRQRSFIHAWLSRVFNTTGYHMMAVTIGWTVYELTHSALDLGLVGLIQFLPSVAFTLIIGHVADRYSRRLIMRIAQASYVVVSCVLLAAFVTNNVTRDLLFVAVFVVACGRAFENPAAQALLPNLVPAQLLSRAISGWSSAGQTAVIVGPALGGLIYAISPILVIALCAGAFLIAIINVTLIKERRQVASREPLTLKSALAGFDFVLSHNRLLGVISLDLVVVLLGGATALLPIFARDILQAGPFGLGILRSAPAVGALTVGIVLASIPLRRHIGPLMFAAVGVFGLATIVFSLSTSLVLSCAALCILGAADEVSVVIRTSILQLETPDSMRGRVSAINFLFINASNTLGDFEAGAVAALIGAVPSALVGGIGSVAVSAIWLLMFPSLRRLDRFATPPEEKSG